MKGYIKTWVLVLATLICSHITNAGESRLNKLFYYQNANCILKKIAWISFWKLVWFLLSLEGTDALKLILKAIFDKSQLDFQHVFWKKWVLKNFAKNHKKTHVPESLFLTLLKKELWYRCFLMNLAKFLRTTFLKSISAGCFRKNIWSKNIFYQLIFETT